MLLFYFCTTCALENSRTDDQPSGVYMSMDDALSGYVRKLRRRTRLCDRSPGLHNATLQGTSTVVGMAEPARVTRGGLILDRTVVVRHMPATLLCGLVLDNGAENNDNTPMELLYETDANEHFISAFIFALPGCLCRELWAGSSLMVVAVHRFCGMAGQLQNAIRTM